MLLALIGIVAKLQVLNAGTFFTKAQGTVPFLLGALLSLITPIKMFLKKQLVYLKYFVLWVLGIVAVVVVVKSPHIFYKHVVLDRQ